MKDLMMIGELARILNTTTKTLRHYEEVGIFSPVYRDPITGYRYYHKCQLKDGYTIISLKAAGVPIKKIERSFKEGQLKEIFSEASERLAGEIKRLTELKETVDRRTAILKKVDGCRDNMKIEYKHKGKREYIIYSFPPIDEIDGAEIYRRALEFEKIVGSRGLPFIFKGALLSLEALRKNDFLMNALIYEVEEGSKVKEKDLYTSSEGRYLCIKYRGDPRRENEGAMKILSEYISEHSIVPEGEVIGFSYAGAHTNSYEDDYWSEIQVRIK